MSLRPSPVEIDRKLEEIRRHELRLAHRAGPGADHFLARDVALLKDLQRGEQFVAEIIRSGSRSATSVASERITSKPPLLAPNEVSMPHSARMIQRSTPYCFSIASSVVLPLARLARRALDARRRRDAPKISADRRPYSGWRTVAAATRGSGVRPAKAAIERLARNPARLQRRGHSVCRNGSKLGGVFGWPCATQRARTARQPHEPQRESARSAVGLRRHWVHV